MKMYLTIHILFSYCVIECASFSNTLLQYPHLTSPKSLCAIPREKSNENEKQQHILIKKRETKMTRSGKEEKMKRKRVSFVQYRFSHGLFVCDVLQSFQIFYNEEKQ